MSAVWADLLAAGILTSSAAWLVVIHYCGVGND